MSPEKIVESVRSYLIDFQKSVLVDTQLDGVSTMSGEDSSPPYDTASVSFLGADRIDILRFPQPAGYLKYVTCGCSRHAMADPNAFVTDSLDGPRAELVAHLQRGVDGIARTLAILAASPSVEGLVLTDGGIINLGAPLWKGAPFTAVSIIQSSIPDLILEGIPEPIRFLQVIPITETEAAWQRARGVEALQKAWDSAGVDIANPDRIVINMGAE